MSINFFSLTPSVQKKKEKKTQTHTTPFVVAKETGARPSQWRKERRREKARQIPTDDFFSIDKAIRDEIMSRDVKLASLNTKIDRLEWIEKHTDDVIERKDARDALLLAKRERTRAELLDIARYEEKTRDLFERYREILSSPIVRSFNKAQQDNSLHDAAREKLLLYHELVCIAKEYVPISRNYMEESSVMCSNCNGTSFEREVGVMICRTCEAEMEILEDEVSFKEQTRLSQAQKCSYSREAHFKEAIDRYMARQNKDKVPKEIYEMLDQMFAKYDISKLDATEDTIFHFLCEEGYTELYEHTRLIHCEYTGTPPPDITDLEEDLIADNKRFNSVLPNVLDAMNINRVNALNVDYELRKHLERRGIALQPNDYRIFKTRKTITEHDDICAECFRRLKWTFSRTV